MVAAATAELRVLETFIDFSFRRGVGGPRERGKGRLAGQLSPPYESLRADAVSGVREAHVGNANPARCRRWLMARPRRCAMRQGPGRRRSQILAPSQAESRVRGADRCGRGGRRRGRPGGARARSRCAAARRSSSRPTPGIGNGISSRNSEVIHAGLYDAPRSLKARPLRRRPRGALSVLRVARRRPPPLRASSSSRATSAQVETLQRDRGSARSANGVARPALAERRRGARARAGARRRGGAALDRHRHHRQPRADARLPGRPRERRRRGWSCAAPLEGAVRARRRLRAARRRRGAVRDLHARRARQRRRPARAGARARDRRPRSGARSRAPWFAKGNYFALAGRSPFTHLIYPVPEPGGLGVHLTLDLAGQARFGPDVEWLDVDVARRDRLRRRSGAQRRRSTPPSAATGPG